jgi:membrane associated rhomboid family serine protease
MALFPTKSASRALKVCTNIPIIIIPLFLPIPATIFIGIWFLGQLLSGTTALMLSNSATGIAFWAHIGGFIGGMLLCRFFDASKKKVHYQ